MPCIAPLPASATAVTYLAALHSHPLRHHCMHPSQLLALRTWLADQPVFGAPKAAGEEEDTLDGEDLEDETGSTDVDDLSGDDGESAVGRPSGLRQRFSLPACMGGRGWGPAASTSC